MAERALKADRESGGAQRKEAFRVRRPSRPPAPLVAVREGFPYGFLASLSDGLGISSRDLAEVVGIPERTLARRKVEGTFSPEESDRLSRLARIAGFAGEVLGDSARAAEWLQRPNPALGGEVPLRWLDTDLGSRQVEDVLGRIAYGVTG